MPTSLAGGRYQLGQLIGRGGMAEVHVGLDTRLGRTVAVKIMRADLANDSIFLSRFRREAHSVAQMNNPNIVNIYDSGEETVTTETGEIEHLPYLVMVAIKGQTLRDILKVNGALSQRDAEQVMMGVLNALEYSHRMGIIHRDIKPGNIMISEQGVEKVMDFGIARAMDDSAATMTQSQGVVGTARFLSPEQARGESVDMRSTCIPPAACCTKCSPAGRRSPAIRRWRSPTSMCRKSRPPKHDRAGPAEDVGFDLREGDGQGSAEPLRHRFRVQERSATFMNGGVPMAAAFNPLTDLTNMKARKQAEFRILPPCPWRRRRMRRRRRSIRSPASSRPCRIRMAESKRRTRAEQRAKAAQERKKKQIIIASVVGSIVVLLAVIGIFFALNGHRRTLRIWCPCRTSPTRRTFPRRVWKNSLRPLVSSLTPVTIPRPANRRAPSPNRTRRAARRWRRAPPSPYGSPPARRRSACRRVRQDAGGSEGHS